MAKKKKKSSGRARNFDLFKTGVGNYKGFTKMEGELQRACDNVIRELHENPPRVLGWLRGGIDTERMEALQKQYEG